MTYLTCLFLVVLDYIIERCKIILKFFLYFCLSNKSVYICNRFLREKLFFKIFKFKIFIN